MSEQIAREQRAMDWWDAWWAQDYSWDGLARKLVGVNGDTSHGGLNGERTLADYWRRDPVTGAVRDDAALKAAGELMEYDGVLFHIAHLPPATRAGAPTWKHDLQHADWDRLEALIGSRLAAGSETKVGWLAQAESPDGRAQLQGAVLRGAAAHPRDKERPLHLNASHAAFLGPLSHDGDTFGPGAGFVSTTFSGDASFDKATFSGDAVFQSATFSGNSNFENVTFSGVSNFELATFSSDAAFEGATFSADASFFRATFSREANFQSATFLRDSGFKAATFSGDTVFHSATFSQLTIFQFATFSRDAVFQSATFSGNSHFENATFSGVANFEFATFSSDAVFQSATFSGNSRFENATFLGVSTFELATFSSDAAFEGATFSGDARFFRATFLREANFQSATFLGDVSYEDAKFSGDTSFYNATFSEDANFGRVNFLGDTGFKLSTFSGHCNFADARFGGFAVFQKAKFAVDGISGGMAFFRCVFSGASVWSSVAFPRKAEHFSGAFAGTRFQEVADFEGAGVHWIAALDDAILDRKLILDDPAEIDADRQFRKTMMSATLAAAKADLDDKVREIEEVQEGDKKQRVTGGEKARWLAEARERRLKELEGGCRVVKVAMGQARDELLEQRYYRFQLMARRHQRGTPLWEKAFSLLYGAASDYGASMTRPFVALAVVIGGFAGAFYTWAAALGAIGHGKIAFYSGALQAFDLSWANVFKPLSALTAEGAAGSELANALLTGDPLAGSLVRVAATVESLCAIVLAFLFALAVRRRFQIA